MRILLSIVYLIFHERSSKFRSIIPHSEIPILYKTKLNKFVCPEFEKKKPNPNYYSEFSLTLKLISIY